MPTLIFVSVGLAFVVQCFAQQPRADLRGEQRIAELMEAAMDNTDTMSTVKLNVLCITKWSKEHHGKLVRFFRDNSSKLPSDKYAMGLRQLAENNPSVAHELIPDLINRLSLEVSAPNLDLVVALRELAHKDLNPIGIEKLEGIVQKENAVMSAQAAAVLLRVDSNNLKANRYLVSQLQSDDIARIWRAAFAMVKSGHVPKDALPLIKRHLSHSDPRIRTFCAMLCLHVKDGGLDAELALSTLAGVLCLPDLPTPTEFVYPSNLGTGHRVFAIQGLQGLGEHFEKFCGPILGILLAEDLSDSSTILRINALRVISALDKLPDYLIHVLTIMIDNPEMLGIRSLDSDSVDLIKEILAHSKKH